MNTWRGSQRSRYMTTFIRNLRRRHCVVIEICKSIHKAIWDSRNQDRIVYYVEASTWLMVCWEVVAGRQPVSNSDAPSTG